MAVATGTALLISAGISLGSMYFGRKTRKRGEARMREAEQHAERLRRKHRIDSLLKRYNAQQNQQLLSGYRANRRVSRRRASGGGLRNAF